MWNTESACFSAARGQHSVGSTFRPRTHSAATKARTLTAHEDRAEEREILWQCVTTKRFRLPGLAEEQPASRLRVQADGDSSLGRLVYPTIERALRDEGYQGFVELRLVSGRAEFRHPLVRSAVYAQAEPALRRAAHRAVAAVLPANAADRRAWQLSEACVGPDESVAEALAATADRARARGAYGAAAQALVDSTPDFQFVPVPEPGTLALLAIAGFSGGLFLRRRFHRQ